MANARKSESTADREIVVSRIIEGPRELVFRVYSDSKHLDRWWGPNGFTTTTRSFEFRTGGEWEFTMHGPDGTDWPNWIRWREIVPNERIELLHGELRDDPNAFESIITFADRDGGTEVTMRALFPTKALRDDAIERVGAIEGGRQTLGRLADYVTSLAAEGGRS